MSNLISSPTATSFSYVEAEHSLYIRMPLSVGLKFAMGEISSYQPACGLYRERSIKKLYGKAKYNAKHRWSVEDSIRPKSGQQEILSPVYGSYTNQPHHEQLVSYARGCASLVIKLKKHCKSNCTFTIGDSFLTGASKVTKYPDYFAKTRSLVEEDEYRTGSEYNELANHWYRRWDEWRSSWRNEPNKEAQETSRLLLEAQEEQEFNMLRDKKSQHIEYIEFQHWGSISWADVEAYEICEWY